MIEPEFELQVPKTSPPAKEGTSQLLDEFIDGKKSSEYYSNKASNPSKPFETNVKKAPDQNESVSSNFSHAAFLREVLQDPAGTKEKKPTDSASIASHAATAASQMQKGDHLVPLDPAHLDGNHLIPLGDCEFRALNAPRYFQHPPQKMDIRPQHSSLLEGYGTRALFLDIALTTYIRKLQADYPSKEKPTR